MNKLFIFLLLKQCVVYYSLIPLLFLCTSVKGQQIPSQGVSGSLTLGDTVPEYFWQIPLKVVNHPASKKTITLNDYRDRKLIIIDFWATWCGSCLNSIRKVNDFPESISKHIIFITKQRQQEITDSKSRFYFLGNYLPFSVVEDSVLSDLFKAYSLPHIVWLENGKLKAVTSSTQLTDEKIKCALRGDWSCFISKLDPEKQKHFNGSSKGGKI